MKIKNLLKSLITKIVMFFMVLSGTPTAKAVCTFVINSTTGYTVNIEIGAVSVNAPSSCPWGYNYTVDLDYNITFSGSKIPSSLHTLQGYLDCGSNTNKFFDLPNSGGNGTTTTSNSWRGVSDCQSATLNSLDCNILRLVIQGPGISKRTLTCTNPLPVELINFEASRKGNTVTLDWATASETNNSHFTLFRSEDGEKWDSIARIEGAGNSLTVKTYQAVDILNASNRTVYYRLKQTDFDGEFAYPALVVVKPNNVNRTLNFQPNPAGSIVEVTSGKQSLGTIRIMNSIGQDVTHDVQVQMLSNNRSSIDLTNLPNGFYNVITPTGTGKFLKK